MRQPVKFTKLLVAVLLAAVVFSSCSKQPESLKAIPKDAIMVTSIDLKSLAIKGKLFELGELEMVQTLKEEAKSGGGEVSDMMQQFSENPGKVGLSFTKPIFIFAAAENVESPYIAVAAEMSSASDFEEFSKAMIKEAMGNVEVEEQSGYKRILMGDEAVVAWDDSKMVMAFTPEYRGREGLVPYVESIMTQDESNSILASADFKSFYGDKKDISLWMSTDFLSELGNEYDQIIAQTGMDIKGSYWHMHTDFRDDEIKMISKVVPNDEVKDMMDKMSSSRGSFDKASLSYFPEKNHAFFKTYIGLTAYSDMIKNNPQFGSMAGAFEQQMGMTVEEALESISGDIMVSLIEFEQEEIEYQSYEYDEEGNFKEVTKTRTENMPKVAIMLNMTNTKVYEKLMESVPPNMYEAKDGYNAVSEFGVKGYFAQKDNMLMITNHLDVIENFAGDGYASGSMKDSKKAGEIASSYGYGYMNMEMENYPEFIQDLAKGGVGNEEALFFDFVTGMINEIEVKNEGFYSGEVTVSMKEGSGNSLNAIVTGINEQYKKVTGL